MKKTFATIVCAVMLLLATTVPFYDIHANNHVATINPGTPATSDPGTPATSDPGTSNINFKIDNPVSGFDDIPSLIVALLEIVMMIAAPVIAVMIIYAGFLFVTARGNATQMENAKKTLLYVVIGAAIILGAKIIAEAISGTITGLM
jgi:hypothetical protein